MCRRRLAAGPGHRASCAGWVIRVRRGGLPREISLLLGLLQMLPQRQWAEIIEDDDADEPPAAGKKADYRSYHAITTR